MNDFHNQLQMLNVSDFQTTQAIPWDQSQYSMDDTRLIGGFGFGRCFGVGFGCFGFGCFGFGCFGCGGFGR
ncbi:heterocycloanthracin/sonorensin family bacteriocin, partial [Bacillus sp. JJ722]|uniref:heterocycloanthracin/sonorensin family bacteriocin n=1 Tax=Bacillus sp. JJ722 TaxID=3122973 RepID=UPI002FFDE6AC